MKWLFIPLLLLITLQNKATVKLPCFVSDGMVLQRDMPIPIWGWAAPDEIIQVSFQGRQYQTRADAQQKWKLQLKPSNAGGPYDMKILGTNEIVVKNILIGDVWFCSGQSNMEYEMYKAQEKYPNEIAAATNPQIRLFHVKRGVSFTPVLDVSSENGWESADPKTILNFSAVAYFFGKKLYDQYKIPIGLILSSYGGTPAEAWMSESGLKTFPHYLQRASLFKDQKNIDSITKMDQKSVDNWYDQLKKSDIGNLQNWSQLPFEKADWKEIQLPSFWQETVYPEVKAGTIWFKKDFYLTKEQLKSDATLRLGNIILRDITWVNGAKVGATYNKHAPRKYTIPSSILKERINTITVQLTNESGDAGFIRDKPYSVFIKDSLIDLKGTWKCMLGASMEVLNRTSHTRFHTEATGLYNAMIEPLAGYGIKGMLWYQGEANISKAKEYYSLFPALIKSWRAEWGQGDFPFLYVQLANNNKPKSMPAESKLAELQDAQTKTLALPQTGMAVANDIGEWNDVHPMNKMEVAQRLFLNAKKIAYNEKNLVHAGPLLDYYEIKNETIVLHFKNMGSGLISKDGGPLKYFSIADAKGKYVWAQAEIKNNTVIVSNPQIKEPLNVRYAWADNPVGANLSNKEGLPASCFSTSNK